MGGEYRGEALHPLSAAACDYGRGGLHRYFHGLIEGVVHAAVAQQAVALLKGVAVAYECVEIYRVGLGYHLVHQASSAVAGAGDEFAVGR